LEEDVYERIVVPLDGSDLAERAIPHAETLSRALKVPIHLVRVVDNSGWSLVDPSFATPAAVTAALDLITAAEREAGDYLESIREHLDVSGQAATTEVLDGPVVTALVAAIRPVDLVVMTTHGRTGLARWFMGSVAEGLLRRSRAPILLVRSGSKD
jgi:nucleotide-binding universal stress UspA family protein